MARHKKKKPKRAPLLAKALIISGGALLLSSSAEGVWCCHDPGQVARSLGNEREEPPTVERECVEYKIDPTGPPLNEPPFRP